MKQLINKVYRIDLLVTPDEKTRLRELAKKHHETLSQYLRKSAFLRGEKNDTS